MVVDYPEEIIVYVVHEARGLWFVSERELWFLDYQPLREVNVEYYHWMVTERFGISVVDEGNVGQFLREMEDFQAAPVFFEKRCLPARMCNRGTRCENSYPFIG